MYVNMSINRFLLLFIHVVDCVHNTIVATIVYVFFCFKSLVFVQYFVYTLVLQLSRWRKESRLLTLIVLLVSCDYYYSLPLSHGAVG